MKVLAPKPQKITPIHPSVPILLAATYEFLEEISFLEKEVAFFSMLLQQADTFAEASQGKQIASLLEEFQRFEELDLMPFSEALQARKEQLIRQKNEAYLLVQGGKPFERQRELKEQLELLKQSHKRLKNKLFGLIDNYIAIHIF